jgi:hypothetical protein
MATAIEDNFVDWAKSALADKKSAKKGEVKALWCMPVRGSYRSWVH